MNRYLFLKILDDAPLEIKHFTDRSAGLKYMAEQAGVPLTVMDAYWDNGLCRARMGTINSPDFGPIYWLYQIEIY